MARPIRKNADYFTHFANFRNDRRVKAIRTQFGVAGYGLTLMLLEVLTDSDGFELDANDIELDLLSGDLGVSVAEIDGLVQFAVRVQLFTKSEAGKLTCPLLNDWLQPVLDKRSKSRNGNTNRVSATETPDSATETPDNSQNDANLSQDAPETTQRRGEESREEESRIKRDTNVSQKGGGGTSPEPEKSPVDKQQDDNPFKVKHDKAGKMILPTLELLTAYVLTLEGGTKAMALEMFEYYGSKGWKMTKTPITNWNLAASRWVRKNKPGGEYATDEATQSGGIPKGIYV